MLSLELSFLVSEIAGQNKIWQGNPTDLLDQQGQAQISHVTRFAAALAGTP